MWSDIRGVLDDRLSDISRRLYGWWVKQIYGECIEEALIGSVEIQCECYSLNSLKGDRKLLYIRAQSSYTF